MSIYICRYIKQIFLSFCQDTSLLSGKAATWQSRVELHTDPALQVGCDWTFHTLALPNLLYSQVDHTYSRLHTYRYTFF